MNRFEEDFKYQLSKFSGFTDEEREMWTAVDSIQETIDKLLNDNLMMKNKNSYSLAERTEKAKIYLFRNLFYVAEDTRGIENELDELRELLC